jgi:hypothetical protein
VPRSPRPCSTRVADRRYFPYAMPDGYYSGYAVALRSYQDGAMEKVHRVQHAKLIASGPCVAEFLGYNRSRLVS